MMTLKAEVLGHTWGHGESGYEVVVYSSHEKELAEIVAEAINNAQLQLPIEEPKE